jgi:diguanylate cyclase (GGDEF)-like protein
MKVHSLNQGIFRLVIGLVLLTSLSILINVWVVTYQQAQNKLGKDIELAQKVLGEVLQNQEELLITSASVLTDDFGFKQAVATRDSATITSALSNHGNRISADLMGIFSLSGETIASTSKNNIDETTTINQQIILAETFIASTLEEGGVSTFLTLNNKVYKVILLRIDAPSPLAIALVGFELTPTFVQRLEDTTQIQVNLLAKEKTANSLPIVVASQVGHTLNQNKSLKVDELAWHHIALSTRTSVTQNFVFYDNDELTIEVILIQQLSKLIAEFSALKSNISIIVFASVLIAVAVAFLYSRKLARPITELSRVAQRISAGDYKQQIDAKSKSKEFMHLSSAFNNMQQSISEREKEITYQAQRDPLTQLYTRYHASDVIDQALNKAIKNEKGFHSVGINIIGFRDINDVFGYQYGDACLIELAKRIEVLGGISARLSGGEFLWVPDIDLDEDRQYINDFKLAEIKGLLEQAVQYQGVSIPLQVTLGTVQCPNQADSAEQLLKLTNIVLDEAKLQPSRMLHYQEEFEQKYIRRLLIITKLKQALTENSSDLFLYYQPKLHLESEQVKSVEALIRWIDPELGFVAPDEFIALAENAGLISQVTDWVIQRAIRDAQHMVMKNIHLCIAINLSAKDITNPYLLDKVGDLLRKANLPANAISFEITESDLVEDPKQAIEHLNNFKQQGYELAIDDFGTGYSSLAYLKSFPVDTLKIDKSFVLSLSSNQDDRDIVETIMQLASKFNLNVVAEGVEDARSLQILAELGCTWAQGFFMCRPIPLPDLIEWCHSNEHKKWLSAV